MYVPKSQITPNLYTNGEEFLYVKNNLPYKGYYHKLSTGKFYTGKNPNDTPVEEIFISQPATEFVPHLNSRIVGLGADPDPSTSSPWVVKNYLKSKRKSIYDPQVKFIPQYSYPNPTTQDYSNGSFIRYVAKKANQNIYTEVNKDEYTQLINKNPKWDFVMYYPIKLTWTLVGESPEKVAEVNKGSIQTAERKYKITGLLEYFKNYSQFYQAG